MRVPLFKQLPAMVASLTVFSFAHAGDISMMQEDQCNLCYAGPRLDCDSAWRISAAAVFQRASVSGSQFGYLTVPVGVPNVGPVVTSANDQAILNRHAYPVQAQLRDPKGDFDWGFKINLGYQFEHDEWHLFTRYKHYQSRTRSELSGDVGYGIVPLNVDINVFALPYVQAFPTFLNTALLSKAISNIKINLDSVDAVLSRPTLHTTNLEVSPFVGVGASWIEVRQKTRYTSNLPTTGIQNTPAPTVGASGDYLPTHYLASSGDYYEVDRGVKWSGVGPKVGLHTNWLLGYNFSLYGDASTGLLYGRSKADTTNGYKDSAPYTMAGTTPVALPASFTPSTLASKLSSISHHFAPETSYQVGLQWSKVLDDRSAMIAFNVGYEGEFYFASNRWVEANATATRLQEGGLGVHGLVLELTIDF